MNSVILLIIVIIVILVLLMCWVFLKLKQQGGHGTYKEYVGTNFKFDKGNDKNSQEIIATSIKKLYPNSHIEIEKTGGILRLYPDILKDFIESKKNILLTIEGNEQFLTYHWYKSLLSDMKNIYHIKENKVNTEHTFGSIQFSYIPSMNVKNMNNETKNSIANDLMAKIKKADMKPNMYYIYFRYLENSSEEIKFCGISLNDDLLTIYLNLFQAYGKYLEPYGNILIRSSSYSDEFIKIICLLGFRIKITNKTYSTIYYINTTSWNVENIKYNNTDNSGTSDQKNKHAINSDIDTNNNDECGNLVGENLLTAQRYIHECLINIYKGKIKFDSSKSYYNIIDVLNYVNILYDYIMNIIDNYYVGTNYLIYHINEVIRTMYEKDDITIERIDDNLFNWLYKLYCDYVGEINENVINSYLNTYKETITNMENYFNTNDIKDIPDDIYDRKILNLNKLYARLRNKNTKESNNLAYELYTFFISNISSKTKNLEKYAAQSISMNLYIPNRIIDYDDFNMSNFKPEKDKKMIQGGIFSVIPQNIIFERQAYFNELKKYLTSITGTFLNPNYKCSKPDGYVFI